MRQCFFFLPFVLGIITHLNAQVDCYKDPSCQHTKSMLLEANRQWDNQYKGINTNNWSEKIDIIHYTINLDMSNFKEKQIKGYCEILLRPKMPKVTKMQLDLLQFKIDSIVMGTKKLAYTYNDTIINIDLGKALAMEDTAALTVYYQGMPSQDKDWGGFYYKDGYAYNLGVGFASDPHNYGRVFHPCFDNFKERATYTFIIKTSSDKRAHCNGVLLSENTLNGFTTRTWKLKDPIPTYLACIAVGDYTTVYQSHQGIQEKIPIELVANENDTSNLKASFVHLKQAIAAYEKWYGPHRWSKVGYSLVPFRAGAMEHATNITYPNVAAKGNLEKESLMAHELGHSWWGNLVTCETAPDMWINEGMASYSVHLFLEYTYGKKRYLAAVKDNHYDVLTNAHIREGGYRPISGVPHDYTYGMHVYDKGAAVAYNMRWYMGDEAYRKGLQYITKTYAFQNLNSAGFRDAMSTATGINMNQFFDDWVFRGGYPNFAIQNFSTQKKGEGYETNIHIRQKLVGRTVFCKEVPLMVTFMDDNWQQFKTKVVVSNQMDSAKVILPFQPSIAILNEDHEINQGRYDYQLKLTKMDTLPVVIPLRELGFHKFNIINIDDSAYLHLEHHPVAANSNQVPDGFKLSSSHYWTVNGILPNSLELEARLQHDDNLDRDLMSQHGLDSLVLLYRPSPNEAWQLHPNFTKKQTMVANFTFTMLKGDYAFANGQVQPEMFKAQKAIKFSTFEMKQTEIALILNLATPTNQKLCIELYNIKGERLFEKSSSISSNSKAISVPLAKQKKGIYFLKIRNAKGKIVHANKLVKE